MGGGTPSSVTRGRPAVGRGSSVGRQVHGFQCRWSLDEDADVGELNLPMPIP